MFKGYLLNIFVAIAVFRSSFLAAAEDNKKIEDVLERLEKKIIQNSAPITSSSQNQEKTSESLEFNAKEVTTDLKENKDLDELTKQSQVIGQRVEQLESDIQKTRQKVLNDANLKQNLAIKLHLLPRSESFLRSARVYLDGYEIYSIDQPQGLWTASEVLPLYIGPTQTGSHKLELEVSVIHRKENPLALNAEQFQTTRLEYPFSIHNGSNTDLNFAIKSKNASQKSPQIILEVVHSKIAKNPEHSKEVHAE